MKDIQSSNKNMKDNGDNKPWLPRQSNNRNNLGKSLELLDPPKRLGVARLELYLGREPRKVQVPGVFSGSDQVQAHTVGYLCAFALCWITSFYPTKKKNLLQVQVNKENLMEFSFNSVYYLYNYYMVCVLLFHSHHVMSLCDILTCDCDIWYLLCDTFLHLSLCHKSERMSYDRK